MAEGSGRRPATLSQIPPIALLGAELLEPDDPASVELGELEDAIMRYHLGWRPRAEQD